MKRNLLLLFLVLLFTGPVLFAQQLTGSIVEDGVKITYSVTSYLPDDDTKAAFGIMAVVAWKYDGAAQGGMPDSNTEEQQLLFEKLLKKSLAKMNLMPAYTRTGNNLKEFVFYVADQAMFEEIVAILIEKNPQYPVEVEFYDDQNWFEHSDKITLVREVQ